MRSVLEACARASAEGHHVQLNAAVLVALQHVEAGTGEKVASVVQGVLLPQWKNLDTTGKELILLHALHTEPSLCEALSASDALLSVDTEARTKFFEQLAVLCEQHANCQLEDAEFVRAAHDLYLAKVGA